MKRIMPYKVIDGKEYYLWSCIHEDCHIEEFVARRSDTKEGRPTGWSWDSCPGCQNKSNTLLSPSEEINNKET